MSSRPWCFTKPAWVVLTTVLILVTCTDGQETPKVEVLLLAEAGCPFCQRDILGPLNDLVQAPGLSNIINLVHHPFGNCYFTTQACGGAPYNSQARICWTTMCGMGASEPPPECFGGDLVPQHGPNEVQVNRMEACARQNAPTWQDYWVFLVCMERRYAAQGVHAAEGCAAQAKLNFDKVHYCYHSIEGDQAMINEATTTPPHDVVPYIAVNGHKVEAKDVLAEVCAAYAGEKPAECSNPGNSPQWT